MERSRMRGMMKAFLLYRNVRAEMYGQEDEMDVGAPLILSFTHNFLVKG
jgi:hypothetical protein